MPSGKDIPNKFYISQEGIECTIDILMQSKDQNLMRFLMESIDFNIHPDNCPYTFEASSPVPNTICLQRKIYVKKKN